MSILKSGLLAAVLLAVAPTGGGVHAQSISLENGEAVFKKCRACHLVGENARNAVGPALNAIVGRRAGAADAYAYSANLKELGAAGLVWDEPTLQRYLENPKAVVPHGKMAFPGLEEAQERADVIAYLKTFSKL